MQSERLQEVGQRIRMLRSRHRMTLRDLSAQCGLSVSFLSQIERGLSSFSIPSLGAICQALDVSLAEMLVITNGPGKAFLADPRPPTITKGDNRSYINLSDTSIKYRFLSGGFPGRAFEALIGELSPGSLHPPSTHGGEEFGYVLEGIVRLEVGEEKHVLETGDSYHLLATTPHGCSAEEKEGAKILWVQTATYAKALSLLPDNGNGLEKPGQPNVPSSDSERIDRSSRITLCDTSIRYRLLSGDFPERHLEMLLAEIPANCHDTPCSDEHEEFGYILEGRVELMIASETYNLGAGDCYHLPATTPHTCQTSPDGEAKVLWVRATGHPMSARSGFMTRESAARERAGIRTRKP